MNRTRWLIIGGTFIVAAVAAGIVVKMSPWWPEQRPAPPGGPDPTARAAQRVRLPAAAGVFYPKDANALAEQVDRFLANTRAERIEGKIRGLICPHAGLRFSGQTAAEAYKQLAGRDVRTVVILAPSHYADFKGASIPDVDAYETPLGSVRLSPRASGLAAVRPFVRNPPCRAGRPEWWRQAPKPLPAFGADTPHTWEHSLEIQLPFLQRTLKDFGIVPIVFGRTDPLAAAEALMRHGLDEQTVIVASSDLSHYYPYAVARILDRLCTKAIVELDIQEMARHEACGMLPILTLMHVARAKGWRAKLLDYCNSGDTSRQKSKVVGYAAIAFFDGPGAASRPATLPAAPQEHAYGPGDRAYLLGLARRTLAQVVTAGTMPEIDANQVPAGLTQHKGCFVTLTAGGKLRGCIGHILPKEPLYMAIMDNTRSAATADKRFEPVRAAELEKIEIEISVLTVPERLEYDSPLALLARLRPDVDGLLLRLGDRQATYLPQVWRQFPNKAALLSRLAVKAKLPPAAWQDRRAAVWTYQAEVFKESQKRGTPPE